MKLTYFDQRGRAEPILLMLVDSGVEYEQEVLTKKEWLGLRQAGQVKAPKFPFSQLPILTFGHGARGGQDGVLAETGAILQFLAERLAPAGAVTSPPDSRARLEMIRSAAATLIDRLLPLAADSKRANKQETYQRIVEPFLQSLEYHLASSFFPPMLVNPLTNGQPGTTLSPAAATASTAISLIIDLFPRMKDSLAELFPLAFELRQKVEARPKIKAWIDRGERRQAWVSADRSVEDELQDP
ncbi:hypothetical protein OIV83_003188 [Microbotryomycetes sp. JL201]|nr:hypothetical protein OIV83_003188 [Microbotryomycetes sp. JL201]